ncbi:MAG: cytochrome oxidase assembly protein [Planctomycetaceae bacterium]|nr:cytochrome oxidase assembly protein [Planctomycetaceae bacterium]|tara:strand:- start:313 stop:1362 length:1050 start_codon:yes stop_codon:yes gene_type:complete
MTTHVELIDKPVNQQELSSPWPKRVAWFVTCLTFPLIFVGGLITTTDAGMAVPDWPTTFGYNMFLYPWYTWFFGPWDLFIEHGHRLFASVVGMVSIAFVFVAFKWEQRAWMRKLVVIALLLVSAQGILGGIRVTENEVLLAMVHGCTAPLFFSLTVFNSTAYTRFWRAPLKHCQTEKGEDISHLVKPLRLATITTVLVYLQLVLGASIRHIPVTASTQTFSTLVVFHLIMALAVMVHVIALAVNLRKHKELAVSIRRAGKWLAGLVLLQVGLGASTWVLNYGYPFGWGETKFTANHLVITYGWWQAHITTAHMAIGSLLLVICVAVVTRLLRLRFVAKSVTVESDTETV